MLTQIIKSTTFFQLLLSSQQGYLVLDFLSILTEKSLAGARSDRKSLE